MQIMHPPHVFYDLERYRRGKDQSQNRLSFLQKCRLLYQPLGLGRRCQNNHLGLSQLERIDEPH